MDMTISNKTAKHRSYKMFLFILCVIKLWAAILGKSKKIEKKKNKEKMREREREKKNEKNKGLEREKERNGGSLRLAGSLRVNSS